MTAPTVSVVVPAFNASATIERCLSSIVAQTVLPHEILVVDDGSRDDTLTRAQDFASRHPTLNWIIKSQPNGGAGAARNAGIAAASGQALAFLDADDHWLPEKLATSIAAFSDDVSMVSHDMLAVDEAGRQTMLVSSRHMPTPGNPFERLFIRGFVATSTVLVRRDLVAREGGFDENLPAAQDYDLWLRLAADPYFVLVVLPKPMTIYALRSGSITTQAFTRLICGLRVIRKLYPLLRTRSRTPHITVLKKALILLGEFFLNVRGNLLRVRARRLPA